MLKRLAYCIAAGLMIYAFSSTSVAQGGSITVKYGDDSKQGSDEGVGNNKGGPPPYAPAHEYRAKHQYRYYPCCNVYSEPSRKVFFYIKGDEWVTGASLPTNLLRSLSGYVNLSLETDKPYEYHNEHVQLYPNYKFPPYRGAKKQ